MSNKENTKENVENKEEINNEVEANEEVNTENAEGDGETEEVPELSELEQKEAEISAANDKFLRLYSEFDNFRRRTAKEKITLTKTAGQDIIKDLLPILDDFQRAIDNNNKSEDIEAVKEGFKLIQHKFSHTLETKGLKPMDSLGEVFDVDKHEALTQIPAPSKKKKGTVLDVIEPGYLLGDKVIRFAKVVVGN